MKCLIFISFLLVLGLSVGDYNFYCKPRPGCDFSGCKPEKQKDYHIDCQTNDEKMQDDMEKIEMKVEKSLKKRHKELEEQLERMDEKIQESEDDYAKAEEMMTEKVEALQEYIDQMKDNIMHDIEDFVNEKVEELEDRFEDKYGEMIMELSMNVEKLQAVHGPTEPPVQDSSLADEVTDCKQTSEAKCGVKCGRFCFWAAEPNGGAMVFVESEKRCVKAGGTPANIYNKQHYDEVLKYLRTVSKTSFSFRGYVRAWLGMTYDHKTRKAKLYDGSEAPYFIPKPTGMQMFDPYVHLILELGPGRSNMYNHIPWSSFPWILCETRE